MNDWLQRYPEFRSHWIEYQAVLENEAAILKTDLGWFQLAPVDDYEELIYLSIELKTAGEDGLPGQEEASLLPEIESGVLETIAQKLDVIYVGSALSDGTLDLFFYARDTLLFDVILSTAMVRFPTYEYDYGHQEDPEWGCYFEFLYPQPDEMSEVANRLGLDQLHMMGDALAKPRQIDHWLYFREHQDREHFLVQVEKENFEVSALSNDNEDEEFPYLLVVSRVDNPEWASINTLTDRLSTMAEKFNGKYDGWETYVVEDE